MHLPFATTAVAAGENAREFASFDVPAWSWLGLVGAIVVMLIVDLLLVHRTAHALWCTRPLRLGLFAETRRRFAVWGVWMKLLSRRTLLLLLWLLSLLLLLMWL